MCQICCRSGKYPPLLDAFCRLRQTPDVVMLDGQGTHTRGGRAGVSPGHRIDVASAVAVVRNCLSGYRHPASTRAAHLAGNQARAAAAASR